MATEDETFACVLTTEGVQRLQLEMAGGDPLGIECIRCGGAVIVCDCKIEGEEWAWVEAARDRYIIERHAEVQRRCRPANLVQKHERSCYFCRYYMTHHRGSECLRDGGPQFPPDSWRPFATVCLGFKHRGW